MFLFSEMALVIQLFVSTEESSIPGQLIARPTYLIAHLQHPILVRLRAMIANAIRASHRPNISQPA
jgi:hypothetical protein